MAIKQLLNGMQEETCVWVWERKPKTAAEARGAGRCIYRYRHARERYSVKAEPICRADKHPQAMRHCLTCGSSPEKGTASEAKRASEVLQLLVKGTYIYKVPQECYVLWSGPRTGTQLDSGTNHDGRNCRESVEQLAVVWRKENKLRIPLQCHETMLKLAHSIPLAGHMGSDKATPRVSQRFYWSTVYWRKTARAMGTVQRRATRVCNMITLPNIKEPFEKIAMDIIGPLPHSQAGQRYVLVVTMPQDTQRPCCYG